MFMFAYIEVTQDITTGIIPLEAIRIHYQKGLTILLMSLLQSSATPGIKVSFFISKSTNIIKTIKVCSHLTFASAIVSTSPSKFNIASMETQTRMHRMGLNPILTFYIDVDANANANIRCEHTLIISCLLGKRTVYNRL